MQADRLQFYSRSADKAPGRGAGESVAAPGAYHDLGLIPHWRRELSNFSAASPVPHDGLTFRTPEHAFHFAKLAIADRGSAAVLSIESGSPLGTSGSGLDARKARKLVVLTDAQLAVWAGRRAEVMQALWRSRACHCPLFAAVLRATGNAQLWHFPGRGAQAERWLGLEAVRAGL